METILSLDTEITLFVNRHYNAFWDSVMMFFSARTVWIPLYLLFIYGVLVATQRRSRSFNGSRIIALFKEIRKPDPDDKKWGLRFCIAVICCVIAVGLADYLSVHCFKNVFLRLRPCCEPSLEGVLRFHNGICNSHQYGFVSSHAANVFALAAFLTPLLQRYSAVRYGGIYLWAAIVGYSRIYLGKHYFGDVVCGALLGFILGIAMFYLWRFITQRLI
jgi:undecaprenyl-diphosphatase